MTKRNVRVTLICEDKQQSTFAREYLRLCGFDTNLKKMKLVISPIGRGSGEQFVRERFVSEIDSFRSKMSYSSSGMVLIFMLDADKIDVHQHLQAFDNLLEAQKMDKRHQFEKIAIIIPKRNIETWIHYLQGHSVNESDAYTKLRRQRECKPLVKHLKEQICPLPLPENAPPSLFLACEELNRIL